MTANSRFASLLVTALFLAACTGVDDLAAPGQVNQTPDGLALLVPDAFAGMQYQPGDSMNALVAIEETSDNTYLNAAESITEADADVIESETGTLYTTIAAQFSAAEDEGYEEDPNTYFVGNCEKGYLRCNARCRRLPAFARKARALCWGGCMAAYAPCISLRPPPVTP